MKRSGVGRRRSARRLVVRATVLAAVGTLMGLVAAFGASARQLTPAAHARTGACPFAGGVIRAFGTLDLAGVAGDIGPSTKRAADVWIPYVNAHGGILGCKLVVDIVDEPFPDVQQCLRHYREAIASNKYAFFFGSFNSACMAVVPSLTNKAGKAIIANSAADHQPFFQRFQRLNFHGAVSTFLEGRGVAVYAKSKGWKKVSVITPNFAYGQDIAKAFEDYFLKIQPGSQILARQFPAFGEKNLQPFINAAVAPKPDAVVGGEFSTDVLTLWKQWLASGLKIPNLSLVGLPTLESVKSADEIPPNSYGFIRGFWTVASKTAVGKTFFDAYRAKFGSGAHPVPSAWSFAYVSGIQMAKALIEATKSVKADDWVKIVESGKFSFQSPYESGPTSVNPVNHMADTCVTVGHIIFDKSLPVAGTYDPKDTIRVCMHDILTHAEAKQLTNNPNVK